MDSLNDQHLFNTDYYAFLVDANVLCKLYTDFLATNDTLHKSVQINNRQCKVSLT